MHSSHSTSSARRRSAPRAAARIAAGLAAVFLACAGFAVPGAAASRSVTWGGEAHIERFHASDLFPGGKTRQADWGVRGTLRPELTLRLGRQLRLRPWVRLVAEAYDIHHDRNVQSWTVGADLKRGGHRLRVLGGGSNHELYFPSASGGAWFDRREVGAELRVTPLPRWLAEGSLLYRRDDFVPIYGERDDHRWIFHTSLERDFGSSRRASLIHIYRHAESTTDLYSYRQNALRLEIAGALPGTFSLALGGEMGLRNYRTGQPFARKFARQDDRWRAGFRLGHGVRPPLAAEVFGEWRNVDSSRPTKDYRVFSGGIALSATH
jgi:hypothetical protein